MSRLNFTGLNAGRRKSKGIQIIGGDGVYFHLEDGRKIIDASNTGGPLGHRHPKMIEAVKKATDAPVVNEGWRWREREKAAEELIDIAFAGETDWVGSVRFALSGSEANDLALSFAQAYTGRAALATRERAYHGMVGLATQMTVQPHWHGGLAVFNDSPKLLPEKCPVRILDAPRSALYTGSPELNEQYSKFDSIETERKLSDVAATIIDYTQGGVYYDARYQENVARAARKAGSLWIADEVVTGLGRSGRWFAFQGGDARPDIVTLGKPLAGGAAPAGAIVFSKEITEAMEDMSWQTYSTFRGHPIAIFAIRAYLEVLATSGVFVHVQDLEKIMRRRLVEIGERHPSVARIDGRGLHWTIELKGPDWRTWTSDTADLPIASRVSNAAAKAGAVVGTSGEQTSLFLAPPLIISEVELDDLLNAVDQGLFVSD
ncbi:MAG: aminotransferase class III-fold pyridoxal phosphate-dependent enzyme [Pseudomonadota bacterium]